MELGPVEIFAGGGWGGFHKRYKILVASPSEMRSDSYSTPQSNVT